MNIEDIDDNDDNVSAFILDKYNIEIHESDLRALHKMSRLFEERGGIWSSDICQMYSDSLFIYGDNDIRRGKGGQAIIRDEKNSMGIPTKHLPSSTPNAFYNDDNYSDNINKITNAVFEIILRSQSYNTIYFPKHGLGTGLARLNIKAPRTYQYLVDIQKDIFGISS